MSQGVSRLRFIQTINFYEQKSTNMIFTEKLYPRITNKVQKPTQVTTQMCCPDGSYKTYVITKSRPSAYVFFIYFLFR